MMGLGLRLGPRSSTPALLLFVAIVFVMGTIHMAVPRETIRTYSPWRDGHLQNPMRPAPQQQQQQQQQQAVQRPVPEHHVEQRPELLPPPEPGFGSISSPKNPYRNRFLVPLFACNEQETGSQMHVRQLLHLAKALNRTAVLPNWGFGIPTISNCRPYAFDDIYEVERANYAGLWNVPYPTFKRYAERRTRRRPLSAMMSAVFFRDSHKYMGWLMADSDVDVLRESCVEPEPFQFQDVATYVATRPNERLDSVVERLRPTFDTEVLFMVFNHLSDFYTEDFPDPLVQMRPTWGLWSGAPFPQWNYSQSILSMARSARMRLPSKYAAMQWRMELVEPDTLIKCSDMFAETVIAECREKGFKTVYVATDMPIGEQKRSKSASFNAPEVAQAMDSINHLLFRLREAEFEIKTWDDIMPNDDEPNAIPGLAEGASGIFDKLLLGASDWLYAANPLCGFKSSYIGSVQTLRQDRIRNPMETDWQKLGITWVGPEIPASEKFWWHITP